MDRCIDIEIMSSFIFVEDSNTKEQLASFPLSEEYGYSDILDGIRELIKSLNPNCKVNEKYI